MQEINQIIQIAVEKIFPHPKNPRKDVGDVTELAESIKHNGIMQNLTVVPGEHFPDDYTVIIGHRRLAAAKLAGLETVPCAVRLDMSEKDQIATMICENMQRTDLTIAEQAESMQMMIDFGESVDSIAQKTGLSGSTVRNRLKIATLDPAKLKESEKRQVTLGEYMKLFEIEDESTRDIVLATIGTNNFDREYQKAIDAQKTKKKIAKVKEFIERNGFTVTEDLKTPEGYTRYTGIYNFDEKNIEKDLQKFKKEDVILRVQAYEIDVFKKDTGEIEEKRKKVKERDEWANKITNQIDEITENLYERVRAAIEGYTPKKGDVDLIFPVLCKIGILRRRAELDKALELLGEDSDDCTWNEEPERLLSIFKLEPEKTALCYVASAFINDRLAGVDWRENIVRRYVSNIETRIEFLELLEHFGFNLADEERALIDGTHEIYKEKFEEDSE